MNLVNLRKKSRLSGFTLIEILIVVSILAILVGIIALSNFNSSLQKGRDAKRKVDLNKLTRHLEDYYNNHGRYPPPDQYFSGTIAGNNWGSAFPSYVSALPQDPLSPSQEYFYHGDTALGNFYVIFTKLENASDSDIITVGCENGCGPNLSYNYVVHSSNIVMLAGLPNGESVPAGSAPTSPPGGGGEGGGDEPSATPGPTSTPAPSPTPTPIPIPTNEPGTCGDGDLCPNQWCGADTDPPGQKCFFLDRCCFNFYEGVWKCYFITNPCQ